MAKETHVSFTDLATNLAALFDRVTQNRETIIVEREAGERAILKPVTAVRAARRRRISAADRAAFLASAGGWKGLVDTEKLKRDIAESRMLSTRPPVEL